MKISFALAALVVTSLGYSSAIAQEQSLESKGVIEAKLDAKSKKVTIVLKGKESGVFVNKEYPMKCTLTIKDGGKLDKAELKQSDVKYEDASGEKGKATSATFVVGADKQVEGSCKWVVCTKTACSSPFTQKFSSN